MGQCSRRARKPECISAATIGRGRAPRASAGQSGLGMRLRQELEDRQAVPDDGVAGQQRRHLACGRMREDLRLGVGRAQIDVDLA